MTLFRQLTCKHDWTWHGWTMIKCKKCDKVKTNEVMNAKLQSEFWEKRIIPGDPVFGREAINAMLIKRGRSI